ncbi:MAG: M20/M25/M40 family metallo-hydrolase [Alphaproteobacteria bacterium]|nr:MAG: M20/M25/M40 family metallo-hydrolase [Alphaproteobacteria bacterium]
MRRIHLFLGSMALFVATADAAARAGEETQSQLPPAPPAEQPVLHEMVAEVSPVRLHHDVETLVGFGTRHTLSETKSPSRGIGAARRWIEAEFRRISKACGGCLEVRTVSDTVSGEKRIPEPTEIVNVIAIQRGTLDPKRVVIVSGDIDSRVSDVMDATSDAPGANDNASGVAGVLEAARVLSHHRFAGTIVYAALSGEEQGLYGGRILAEHALAQGWRVKAMLNNDMIGNIAGIDGVIDNTTARVFSEGTRATETPREARIRRFTGGEVDSPSRNLARLIDRLADRYVPNLDVMMIYRLDRFGRGGHHRPFNEKGMPAVRIMEAHENYTRQHQDVRVENGIHYGDTIEGVDFGYAAKLTALNVVTLATLAAAPPFPSGVKISGAVSPDTTLHWKLPAGRAVENLAGYRIYWRLTDQPQWQWSRWVGRTDHFTLKNIVIDNYFFGVASVSREGFESPVVFPGPAGSFGE